MSGDNEGQSGPVGGLKGTGWGQQEGCSPSVLAAAAAASGTHFECWMSKKGDAGSVVGRT